MKVHVRRNLTRATLSLAVPGGGPSQHHYTYYVVDGARHLVCSHASGQASSKYCGLKNQVSMILMPYVLIYPIAQKDKGRGK